MPDDERNEGQPQGTEDNEAQGNQQPNPPAQTPSRESGDAPKQRTYTEDEFNAILTSRLSKHEKAVRKAIEQEQEEKRKEAEMTALEKAKAIEEKAQATIKEYEKRMVAAERVAKLAGKVTKPERVLKLMDDPDSYFKENGKLDEKALAADFPEYLPKASAPEPDNSPARSGSSIDDMIRRSAGRGG